MQCLETIEQSEFSLYRSPMDGSNASQQCPETKRQLPEGDEDLSKYQYLFIFAQILMGIAMAPKLVLAPTYVDESISQSRSPKLLGKQ